MSQHVRIIACAIAAAASGCGAPKPPATIASSDAIVIQPPMAHYFRELDLREQREQIRDWAVIGTVAQLGAAPAEAAAATYELPPARLPYLDELYSFEHGDGRRAYFENRVLLFRDAEDPDPQATIGRLADRVRMENGEVPQTVEVYVVHDARDEGAIRIDRAPDVSRDELFSSAYGYVEGEAGDVSSLSAWLDQADDLTFVDVTPEGRVRLGGRRFAGTRTANLTAEDVAALYQAHDELERPQAQARARIAKLRPEAKEAADRFLALAQQGKADSREAWEELYRALWYVRPAERTAVSEALGRLLGASSPGFSLDPEWLPDPMNPLQPLMLARLQAFAADPCRELGAIAAQAGELEQQEPDVLRRTARTRTAGNVRDAILLVGRDLPGACEAIERDIAPQLTGAANAISWAGPAEWDRALAGRHGYIEKLLGAKGGNPHARSLTVAALEFYEQDTSVQCGRYLGLQGTRVGMTLFYTDLVAKLWAFTDYGLSAPTIDVPGFLSTPRLDLSASYLDEMKQNRSTRLWFGPRAEAVSRAGEGRSSTLLFDHRFVRVFAAGSNPVAPGIESQPAEDSRRVLGWWDRHFDEIADHEQEYHRQNQIEKWALVTATLADASAATYLQHVRVRRDFSFPAWHTANRASLRFSEALPVVQTSIEGKECVPIISSYPFESAGRVGYISGGVSTVARSAPGRIPVIRPSGQLGARKPYVADLGAGKAGTANRALATQAGEDVRFFNAAGARTRTPAGEVKLGDPAVKYRSGGATGKLEIHAGNEQRPIGVLQIEAKGKAVDLGWRDGAVELGRRNATVATDLAGADRLAASGKIVDAAQAYTRLGARAGGSAHDLARAVVTDAARRNPSSVLKTLHKLEGSGKQLSPTARSAVERSVAEVGSPAAAKHVAAALQTGKPLRNASGVVTVERGKLVVTRDIEGLSATPLSRAAPIQMSRTEVYVDTRLRVGREGLAPDPGGHVARWSKRRDVTIEVMDRSAIGALPDQIVVRSTSTTLERVPATRMLDNATKVLIIRRAGDRRGCDDSKRTRETSDDCAEQR